MRGRGQGQTIFSKIRNKIDNLENQPHGYNILDDGRKLLLYKVTQPIGKEILNKVATAKYPNQNVTLGDFDYVARFENDEENYYAMEKGPSAKMWCVKGDNVRQVSFSKRS